MQLTTPVTFPESLQKFDYADELGFVGSCFSENIGSWLRDLKFKVLMNPLGIVYNPLSIADQLMNSFGENFENEHIVARDSGFAHLDLHKSFIFSEENDLVASYRNGQSELRQFLLSGDKLFISFGSSIAFRYKRTGKIISNCQKVPQKEFTKELLEESEMFLEVSRAFSRILDENPKMRVYLTVSPVRHFRHGAIVNQRSKARCIRLCELLENSFDRVSYLPIYEFVVDELRDYRFYNHFDLVHLNDLGLQMIKEKIIQNLLDPEAKDVFERIQKWLAMTNHRILNPGSKEAQKFREKLKAETMALKKLGFV